MADVLATVRKHLSKGAIDQAIGIFCHELDKCNVNALSSSGSGSSRDVLVIRCLLVPIRVALCPHSATIYMKDFDVKTMLLLKNVVFKALPQAAWRRVARQILTSDLNDRYPYDGSAGLVDYITMKVYKLMEMICDGRIDDVQTLLDTKDDVSESVLASPSFIYAVMEVPTGWTLMHLAASSKRTTNESVQVLLSYGLTLNNHENDARHTPLHVACSHRNYAAIEALVRNGCSLTILTLKKERAIDMYVSTIVRSRDGVNRLDTASSFNSTVLSTIMLLLHDPVDLWYVDKDTNSVGFESNILYLILLQTDDLVAESVLKVAVSTPKKHWNGRLMAFIALKLIAKRKAKLFELVYKLFENEILDDSKNNDNYNVEYNSYNCPREVKISGVKLLYFAAFINSMDIATFLLSRGLLQKCVGDGILGGSRLITNVTSNTVHAINIDITILLQLVILRGNNRLLMLLINESKEFIVPLVQNAVSDVYSLYSNRHGNIIDINRSNDYIQYLSPITLACLLNNREILKTVIYNVPSKALASSFLSCKFNPIAACVLTSNLEGLHIIHSYIGSTEFARACYTISTECRTTPFHILFVILCRHLKHHIINSSAKGQGKQYKKSTSSLLKIKLSNRSLRDIFEFLSLISIKSANQTNLMSSNESKISNYTTLIVDYDDSYFWSTKVTFFQQKLASINEQLNDNIVKLNIYSNNNTSGSIYGSAKVSSESAVNISALYSLEAAKESLLSSFNRWSLLQSRFRDFKFILGVRMIANSDVIDIKCNKLAYCILTVFEYNSKGSSINITSSSKHTIDTAPDSPSIDNPIQWTWLKELICGLAGSRMSSKMSAERARKFSNNLLQYSFPFTFDGVSVANASGCGGRTVSRDRYIKLINTILDGDSVGNEIEKIKSFFDETYFTGIVKKAIKKCTIKKCTIISDYLLDSLKSLFLWLQTIIDDCIIKYGLSSAMLSQEYINNEHVLQEERKIMLVRMTIVNLLSVRAKYEYAVSQIAKFLQISDHKRDSSNILLQVLLNNCSESRADQIDSYYESLHKMIKDAINSGIIITDPISTSIGVTATNFQNSNNRDSMICYTLQLGAENQESIGGKRRKFKNDNIGNLCDDMACLLIGKRDILKYFEYENGSSLRLKKHMCPLLLLCYNKLWNAATKLLQTYIGDGHDVSSSLYLVTNTDYKSLLSDFHNIMAADNSLEYENIIWQDFNIHRTLVVTPLHFAIESNKVDFVTLFLDCYTNYVITTELIEFAIYTGRNEIAILLLAKANYIKVSPLDAITSTFKNHVTTSISRDTYKKSNIILEFLKDILLDITDNLSVSYKVGGGINASNVVNSASDYSQTLSETTREYRMEPHFEGILQGFFTTTDNSQPSDFKVVLMDGSDVPLSVFRSNYSFYSRALPPPAVSAGFNNAGKNVLHKAASFDRGAGTDGGFELCRQLMGGGAWRVMAVDNNGHYPVYNSMLRSNFSLANQMLGNVGVSGTASPAKTSPDASSSLGAIDVTSLHSIHTSLFLYPRLNQLLYGPALANLRKAEDLYADVFLRQDESASSSFGTSTNDQCPSTQSALSLLAKAFVKLDDIVDDLMCSDFSGYIDILYTVSASQLDSLTRSSHILASLGLGLGIGLASSGDGISDKENGGANRSMSDTADRSGILKDPKNGMEYLVKKHKRLLNSFRNISLSSLQEIVSLETAHKINSIVCGWFRVHNTTISKVRMAVKTVVHTANLSHNGSVKENRKRALNLFATRLDENVSFSKRWDLDCVSIGLYGYENIITNNIVVDTIKHAPNNEIKLLTSQLLLENCISYNNLKYNHDDRSANNHTNLEIILKSLNFNISGIESALMLSYKLIEFGRWVAITRQLIAATNSGETQLTGGEVCHPLESVRRNLLACRQNEHFLSSLLQYSVDSSKANEPIKGPIKIHEHDFGVNFRLKICDSLSINQLSAFFSNKFKFSISTKFQSVKNIITKGIELVLNIIMLCSNERGDVVEIVGIFDTLCSASDDIIDENNLSKLLFFLQNIKISDATNLELLKKNATHDMVNEYFEELSSFSNFLKRVSSQCDPSGCNLCFDNTDDSDIDVFIASGAALGGPMSSAYPGVADRVASESGLDVDAVNNLLPIQLSSQYNKNILKNRIKVEMSVVYEALSILQWVVRGFSGLHRHKDIYALDIRYKLNKVRRIDPLAVIATPTILLQQMHYSESTAFPSYRTNNDLWIKSDELLYNERLKTLRHYYNMNISRYFDRNRLADELTAPLLFSATFGGDVMLREILNLLSTFDDLSSTFAASVNHDSTYIIWSVLMLFPSPVDASLHVTNQVRSRETIAKRVDKYHCYVCCLQLLLDRGFPVTSPQKAFHNCTTIAAMKCLPPNLLLRIHRHDCIGNGDSLPLRAIAFSILSNHENDCFLSEIFATSSNISTDLSTAKISLHGASSIVCFKSIRDDVNIFSNYLLTNLDIASKKHVDTNRRLGMLNIIKRSACDTIVESLLFFYKNVANKQKCPLWLHINETAAEIYLFSAQESHIIPALNNGDDSISDDNIAPIITNLPPWYRFVTKKQASNSNAVSNTAKGDEGGSRIMLLHCVCLAIGNIEYFEKLVKLSLSATSGDAVDFIHLLILFCCYYNRPDSLKFVLDTFGCGTSTTVINRRVHFFPLDKETTALEILFSSRSILGLKILVDTDASLVEHDSFGRLLVDSIVTGGLSESDIITLIGCFKKCDKYTAFLTSSAEKVSIIASRRKLPELLSLFLNDFIEMDRSNTSAIASLVTKCLQTCIPAGNSCASRAIASIVYRYCSTLEALADSFEFVKAVKIIKHTVRLFLLRRWMGIKRI